MLIRYAKRVNRENNPILGSKPQSRHRLFKKGNEVWQYTACRSARTRGVVSCSENHRSTFSNCFEIVCMVTYSHQRRRNQLWATFGSSIYSMNGNSHNSCLCTIAITRHPSCDAAEERYDRQLRKIDNVPPLRIFTAEITIVFILRVVRKTARAIEPSRAPLQSVWMPPRQLFPWRNAFPVSS